MSECFEDFIISAFSFECSQVSFDGAKQWIEELQRQGSPDIIIGLAGNKTDLEEKRQVGRQVREWKVSLWKFKSSYNSDTSMYRLNIMSMKLFVKQEYYDLRITIFGKKVHVITSLQK